MQDQHAASLDLMTLAAGALSAGPNLPEAEKTARFETAMAACQAFVPAGPGETIVASLIAGHHLSVLDGFRDIASQDLTPAETAKARMVAVAQTKIVLELIRTLRTLREDTPPETAKDRPESQFPPDIGLDRFQALYSEALNTLKNAGLADSAAGQAPAVTVGASRAQRRAMMKRQGGFKRAS